VPTVPAAGREGRPLLHEADEEKAVDALAASPGLRTTVSPPVDRSQGPARGTPPGSGADDPVGRPDTDSGGAGPDGPARAKRSWVLASTRSRMVAAYLVLLVVTGVVAGLGIRQVLVVRLDNRTEAALGQEVAEVRNLVANGDDPSTGQPFDSLERAFDVYMERNIPSPEEAFVTLLDGRLHRDRLRSFPGRELSSGALATWSSFSLADGPDETTGTFDTARGEADFHAVRFTLGDERGAFVVTILPAAERRNIEELQTYGAAVMVAAVLAAAVCAWFLAGRVLAPVRELTRTARSISESDRTARIRVSGTSEAAEMATTFNAMLDRLDRAYQSQIDFVRAAGHELRTPLTVASGHLELLGDEEDERRTVMPLVLDELSRMGRMVDDLQSLIEAEGPDFLQPETVDAELLAHELVAKASALGDRAWRLDHASEGSFVADKHRLTEAVLNLADNAVNHTEVGDQIAIGLELTDGWVRIWVRDVGTGVSTHDAERIFDRFTRGRGATKRYRGAGLGLAIVQSIAEVHGGRIELTSEEGRGARFTIVIPRRSTWQGF
jgi:two-component system, OmpR family, sensor kinase